MLSNFLDGFANAAEALVGDAVGAKNARQLNLVIKATGVWSFYVALLAFIAFFLFAPLLIQLLTNLFTVQQTALAYLPWMLALPFTATLGFWLDGVFVGAMRAQAMRNTMLLAVALFLSCGR